MLMFLFGFEVLQYLVNCNLQEHQVFKRVSKIRQKQPEHRIRSYSWGVGANFIFTKPEKLLLSFSARMGTEPFVRVSLARNLCSADRLYIAGRLKR